MLQGLNHLNSIGAVANCLIVEASYLSGNYSLKIKNLPLVWLDPAVERKRRRSTRTIEARS
jgi:hypothetical protein